MTARILTSSVLAVAACVGAMSSARADRVDPKHDGKPSSVHAVHGKRSAAATRNLIFKEVRKRDEENTPDKPTNNSSTMVGSIEFKLLSSGQSVTIKAGSNNNKQMQVECPDPSKPVSFSIANKGDKRLGVDVKLNGTSLLLRQSDASEACRVWVLEPGKSYELKGYYEDTEKENVAPFKILTGDAAKSAREQLGDKAGEILINVFEEGVDAPEMEISRGLRGHTSKVARGSLHSLQRSLMASAKLKRTVKTVAGKKRELIVEDTEAAQKDTAALKAVDFKKGSSAVASLVIKVIPAASTNAVDAPKAEEKKPEEKKPENKKSAEKTNEKMNEKKNDDKKATN